MQTNFPTDPTHGPIRGVPSTIGSRLASIMLNFFSDSAESVSFEMSGTTLPKSRIRPVVSINPGRSTPALPNRTNFTLVSPQVLALLHCLPYFTAPHVGSVANRRTAAMPRSGNSHRSPALHISNRSVSFSHRVVGHHRVPSTPERAHLLGQPERYTNVLFKPGIF